MPEYPDLTVYLECLKPRVLGRPLKKVRLGSPFVLRSVEPPLVACENRRVQELRRIGKRLVFGLEGGIFMVIHLMIAGRLKWQNETFAKLPGSRKSQTSPSTNSGPLGVPWACSPP